MKLLAIDLGTSFIKGGVLDLETLQIGSIRRQPFPGPVADLPQLFYEIDPAAVLAAVRALLNELIALAPEAAGIVWCTQMHGLVLCTATGEARSNFINWQDQRSLTKNRQGETYLDAIAAQLSDHERSTLGNELQPSRPLAYLYWLAQNDQLPNEKVYPVGLADFVIANLCQAEPSIEATGAAAHCAFDLTTGDWHWDLIRRLGLGDLSWPTIHPFGAAVGTLRIDGHALPCYTPVGDHQCALVGALLAPDELSLNISTGSQASMVTPSLQLGDYQTRPFFDGHFLNTITGIPAGRALNHLVKLLSELAHSQGITLTDPWPTIAAAAEAVQETDLTVNLAFFASVAGQQGQIGNIQEHNLTVGHLFHAAFKHMAENYAAAAQRLAPGKQWQQLVFSGVLAQKIPVLRTLIQRQFGVETRLSPSAEDTMLGLLALGLAATRHFASVSEAIQHLRLHYREAPAD